ncbi:hypothetical protein WJX81_003922 [Elliptochloris bilobata]|uniref:DNA damage-inducible protein 1 n=1 Tax=Elliptochloris bilobata TaxID=381761 RepID=A0AAW1QUH1_9CHLO
MRLTVVTEDEAVVNVDVSETDSVDTLMAILEAETGVGTSQQRLLHNGKELLAGCSFSSAGVKDGDLISLLQARPPGPLPGASQAAQGLAAPQRNADGSLADPQAFIGGLLANLGVLASIPPAMADVVRRGDVATLNTYFRHMKQQEDARREEDALHMADPFNAEAQAKIAERIQQAAVEESYQHALDHAPEIFTKVVMLYVNVEVNGQPIKAFVDSGAQSSIMSQDCARRCNLLHLLDKRFQGMAVGVGSGKIVGQIHQATIKVQAVHLPMSITVLESGSMEFLFGLDMLRRYQCCIDLKRGVLRLDVSPPVELLFLAEHELPPTAQPSAGAGAPYEGLAEGRAASSTPALSPSTAAAAAAAARASSAGQSGSSGQPQSAAATSAPVAGAGAGSGSGSAPVGPPPAAEAAAAGRGENAAKVERLVGLGFSRQQCEEMLAACGGDEEHAASLLFDDAGGF